MTALSYRDYQNAQHALSQAPPAVPFSAPSDVFAARFESGMFMGSAGRNLAAREATNRFASWYEERTGQRYPEVAQKVRDEIALATDSSPNYQPAAIPDLYSPEVADAVRQKYLSENPLPALRDVPPPAGVVADDIARTSEEVANELSERAGTLGETFGLVGDLASGMLSPETLATMLFTPVGVAAVGGRAILQIAGREAAFGAGFEIPAQVAIQTRREELGFDAGFWQGAMNVAVVGGLSGVLGGVIRGVVEARNAIRANRTVPGSTARRLYEDLSPDAQRTLEDTSFDVRAVADVVTREFETNARFRNRLRTAEREAIERAIQIRNNMLPFQPRSQAEVEAVDAAIRDVGASLETGLPFRPDTLRAAGDTLPVAPRRAPEVPEALKEHAPDEVKEAVRALEAEVPPTARAPAEQRPLRFSKGQKERFDELLRQEGRSEAEARAAIDAGEVSTGMRGQVTKKSIDELRSAFARIPRNLPPPQRAEAAAPPPRTVADLQGRPADLPPLDATTARIGEQEVEAIRKMTDAQRADEAEASLRARAGVPEEAQGRITGFTTSRGSTYAVDGASTTRNKAARNDPGHEGDAGPKRPSARTIYLETDAAELSAAGLQGDVRARVLIRGDRATLLLWNEVERRWGVSRDMREGRQFFTEPAEGRYPLELWDAADDVGVAGEAYRSMHAGNEITQVTRSDPGVPAPRAPAIPEQVLATAVVRDIDTLKAIEAAVEGCRFG